MITRRSRRIGCHEFIVRQEYGPDRQPVGGETVTVRLNGRDPELPLVGDILRDAVPGECAQAVRDFVHEPAHLPFVVTSQ